MADRGPDLLNELLDDPDDEESDYGRGYAAGRAAAEVEHRRLSVGGVEAAVEAATTAIHDVDCPDGSHCIATPTTWGRYGRFARVAVTAAEPLIRADERANVRAELLAWGDGEHLIRLTADRIAPEPGSSSQVSGAKL